MTIEKARNCFALAVLAVAICLGVYFVMAIRHANSADCGKVSNCDAASTPYSGNEIFYLIQGGRSKKGVLGDLANFILSLVSSAPSLGLSVCSYASCSSETTTGTTTAGQAQVTLADGIDFPATCRGGVEQCGILIGAAGAGFALGQPGSFALAGACGSQAPLGNTTSGSKIILGVAALQGISVGNGITGAGIPASTTITGYNVDTQTITISANATATASGVTLTITDPCTSSISYRIASFDTNGGVGLPVAGVTLATAPARPSTWNVVCLTWTDPGSAAGYAIWKSTDGGVTYNFWATSNTEGSGSCAVNVAGPLWDIGQPAQPRPWWIPNDPATIPAGGQADWLATTFIGGGTTTSLTLATPALQSVIGATVMHDDTAGWATWLAVLNGAAGATNGYIPGTANLRLRTGGAITVPNVQIMAQPGATIRPMGAAVGTVLEFRGSGSETSLTTAGNLTEGSSCLPLSSVSGLAIGDWLLIQQAAPGGASQSNPYNLFTSIASLTCEGVATGVRLTDPATVSFTDAAHTETATITGTPAANDTVQVSVTGDYACSATYTVGGGETTTSIARGLALAWYAACPSILATHTTNVVTLRPPGYMTTLNWAKAVTLGGGGTEDVTLAVGTGYTVQKTPLAIAGVGLSGLRIEGRDAVGGHFTTAPPLIGVRSNTTAMASFKDLAFFNFNGGAFGFYSTYGRGNLYADILLNNGSGGALNIATYSDFWSIGDTKSQFRNIRSSDALSFGPQFEGSSGITIDSLTQSDARAGRGLKFGAVSGSQISNIDSANSVYDNIIFSSGGYRNSIVNIRSTYAYGTNPDGIVFFDAWNRFNTLTNIQAVGSRYDLVLQPTDLSNTIIGGFLGLGSGFATVYDTSPSSIAYNVNGCDKAYNIDVTLSGAMICVNPVLASGAWTPTLVGSGTAGSTSYSTRVGTWEQNERAMTVRFAIRTSAALSGMVGDMQVLGLPRAPVASSDLGVCAIGLYSGVAFGVSGTAGTGTVTQMSGLVLTGGVGAIQLYEGGSDMIGDALAVGAFANPVILYGSCTYRVF